jgi:trehalose 6-phosphate synthase/phosphatase
MSAMERADRMRRNIEYSARLTTNSWAVQVLNDLKSVEKSSDPDSTMLVGFGMQYKVMDLKTGFQQLDVADICKNYRTARHRLIVLDWGGTLVNNFYNDKLHAYAVAKGHAEKEVISDDLQSALEALCSDVKNIVFVVSGKEQPTVAQFFGGIKHLGLGAEHGFYYKWPRGDESLGVGKWHTLMEVGDQSWKDTTKVVMDLFVQRTHGTYIEQKGNALIWQFSEADPEFGKLQSKELEEHLHLSLRQHPVEIIRGGGVSDGYIEVRPAGASKGLFLEHCLSALKNAGTEADFVLTVGDDSSDEPMFQVVAERKKGSDESKGVSYSVTVGKKPTAAESYLDDPLAVLELVNALSKCSEREKRYFSTMDLPSCQVRSSLLPVTVPVAASSSVKTQQIDNRSSATAGLNAPLAAVTFVSEVSAMNESLSMVAAVKPRALLIMSVGWIACWDKNKHVRRSTGPH